MKTTLWLLLCLLPVTLLAQSDPTRVRLDAELHNAEWRFNAGDDTTWASPAYIDTTWATTSLNVSNRKLAPLWQAEKGWFRLDVQASKRLIGRDTYLAVAQYGQSELYLDGKRLATFKPEKIDSGGNQRLVLAVPLRFADTNRHVLAVRYAFQKSPTLYAETGRSVMTMRFSTADKAVSGLLSIDRYNTVVQAFCGGVYGLLSMLLFLFYRTNKTRKTNRILGFAMLFAAISSAFEGLGGAFSSLTALSVIDLLNGLLEVAQYCFFLTAVYIYLNRSRSVFYYAVLGAFGALFLYRLLVGPPPTALAAVPYSLFMLNYIQISWLGKRSGNADSALPWNSLRVALSTLALFVVIILVLIAGTFLAKRLGGSLGDITPIIMIASFIIMTVATLSIPVGLSLSLVRDYARTHQSLGDKLKEVESLSAKTLAQEQEKQAILAEQNERLEQQVQERTAALNQSLTDLRATQDQLVQREKLASLGELTAGIAHEIQNPLNFVNNFSEVSAELLEEVRAERTKPAPERDDTLTDELLGDLTGNVGKIYHHGQRAASIVRGMLEHSRNSTGERTPTDLNALVDEYLRLAYHGLRAKDKTFQATLKTDFTADLPLVNVAAQDLGRVLVNLFNNAFYAVQQRNCSAEAGYVPTVMARTQRIGQVIELVVEDNGTGMPDEVKAKIFQPFFTTKPTGQGTGLGLSLSYDIITKGHNGTLTVESEPGQFSRFTITLPV